MPERISGDEVELGRRYIQRVRMRLRGELCQSCLDDDCGGCESNGCTCEHRRAL